jgi:hypothetical protein
MKDMTCPAMRPFLTLDLCAVGSSEHGAFMVTAAEGYWDDQDRYPEVPLDFTVYVHTKRNGPARVMSVVSGSFTVPYYGGYTDTISIHSLRLAHQDVVALFYSAKASDENESDDSLQLIAMSATGSPEVIAVYEGKNLTFGSMNNSIVVATSRNGVTSAGWATVTTLSQSQQGDWQESITSQRRDSLALNGAVEPVAIDKYTFPSPDTATGNDTATNA